MGFLVTRKSKFDDFDYNRNFMDIRINFVENKDSKAEEDDILNNDENTHKKYDVTCILKMLVKKDDSLQWCEISRFRKFIASSMKCELFDTYCLVKVYLRTNIIEFKFYKKSKWTTNAGCARCGTNILCRLIDKPISKEINHILLNLYYMAKYRLNSLKEVRERACESSWLK